MFYLKMKKYDTLLTITICIVITESSDKEIFLCFYTEM